MINKDILEKLEEHRQRQEELTTELKAISIRSDFAYYKEKGMQINVHLCSEDFLEYFPDFDVRFLGCENTYPYEVSAVVDNIQFFSLLEKFPEKEKSQEGAEAN